VTRPGAGRQIPDLQYSWCGHTLFKKNTDWDTFHREKAFEQTTSLVGSSRCDRALDSAATVDQAQVLWSWNWMSIPFVEDLHAKPQVVTRSEVDG